MQRQSITDLIIDLSSELQYHKNELQETVKSTVAYENHRVRIEMIPKEIQELLQENDRLSNLPPLTGPDVDNINQYDTKFNMEHENLVVSHIDEWVAESHPKISNIINDKYGELVLNTALKHKNKEIIETCISHGIKPHLSPTESINTFMRNHEKELKSLRDIIGDDSVIKLVESFCEELTTMLLVRVGNSLH